jgi:isocitrate dehydrogenase
MPNLYGDILSDVAAQIAGSVGLAGSANIGESCAMFEAIHGSAPRRAGKNLANPSGLLLGSVLMLVHIDQPEIAAKVHNGWLRTLEDGVHTYDVYTEGVSTIKVGTKEFAAAVIERLGQKPNILKPVTYAHRPEAADPEGTPAPRAERPAVAMELKGIDVFVYSPTRNPNTLADAVGKLAGEGLTLQMIDNRGVKVWPDGPKPSAPTASAAASWPKARPIWASCSRWPNGFPPRESTSRSPRRCAILTARPGSPWRRDSSRERPSTGWSDHGQQVGLGYHAPGR